MQILIIQSKDSDYELIKSSFQILNKKLSFVRSKNVEEARDALKRDTYDLIVIELNNPEQEDIHTVQKIIEYCKPNNTFTKILAIANTINFSVAKHVLKMGCIDFITKNQLTTKDLERSIRNIYYHTFCPIRKKRAIAR